MGKMIVRSIEIGIVILALTLAGCGGLSDLDKDPGTGPDGGSDLGPYTYQYDPGIPAPTGFRIEVLAPLCLQFYCDLVSTDYLDSMFAVYASSSSADSGFVYKGNLVPMTSSGCTVYADSQYTPYWYRISKLDSRTGTNREGKKSAALRVVANYE